ncbi:uncharacterized protein mus304 [Venturia canescens]|uniref:uncharacterized protein mus304 n=1 Tax=Venturia canescens TaxID=32260 RepID=UPI001C9C652C|nr:uncharacterized protein LOC122417143 [Venturia canescens]
MSKRFGKAFDSDSSPAKRAKIGSPLGAAENVSKDRKNRFSDGSRRNTNDDLWGDDFDENAIEEMDFIASQACSQDVDADCIETKINLNVNRKAASAVDSSEAEIGAGPSSSSRAYERRPVDTRLNQLRQQPAASYSRNNRRSIENEERLHSQKISSSENLRELGMNDSLMAFDDFKSNLLQRHNINSTFCPNPDVVLVPDEKNIRRLEKLEQENKKLLDDFMTKEGETVFLRSQLQQTQLRAENEKLEKARFIEEQASRHRAELDALHKEKENLKTQNEFQALQLGSLMERCKLLESGAVKLTQPQKAVMSAESPNRSRFGQLNRSVAAVKTVKVSEISVQTSGFSATDRILKTLLHHYPLDSIPQSIFEPSLPEKSVVDIQIIEKIGRKNLPILQEENTFRIFENPVLVKPIVSTVNGRTLNVEFFLPDIAVMMKKTSTEINSEDCIPIVNKIVSATRELFLNSTIVLETIFAAMKNDDIRDMNDLYLSDFYDNTVEYDKSICDSNVWYEKERGIEARRAMAVLSYVAKVSNYLCEYITGRSRLITDKDRDFSTYNDQMIRYNSWAKKDEPFEMLEMILDFVTALGLVRRSHQFSGLLCAIARMLCSVQRRVGFCPRGLEYVTRIFKEMVFSRPLLRCFPSLTVMMETFCKSRIFGRSLCSSRSNVKIWNGALHFTSDACSLEIFMSQIERFRLDDATTICMSDSFLSSVNLVIVTESISWVTESSTSCNCCSSILSYAITLLCQCSKINLNRADGKTKRSGGDELFWTNLKKKQMNALKKGIKFLSYLAKREPDFIMRVSDIEDSFHLFMQHVTTLEGLQLHENEQEALTLIKLTLSPESQALIERRSQQSKQIFSIKSVFEDKPSPSASSGRWFQVDNESLSDRSFAMYAEVLKT